MNDFSYQKSNRKSKPFATLKRKIKENGDWANFAVKWNNADVARFHVYFDGIFSGYDVVRIVFVPSGQVLLLDNERIFESLPAELQNDLPSQSKISP